MIEYRLATLDDVLPIKQLSDEMLTDTKLGLADVIKIARLVTGPHTNMFVADKDGEVVGFIGCALHTSPFNNFVRASDVGVFVKPTSVRESVNVGRELIGCFESWAKNHGAKQCWLSQTTGHKIEKTKKYYERQGYQIVGFNSVKDI